MQKTVSRLTSSYTSVVAKRLIKALTENRKQAVENYELKHDLLLFFREKNAYIKEKKFSPQVKVELELSRKNVVITFNAGRYGKVGNPKFECFEDFFPFQVSYNEKYEACLHECFALEHDFVIQRSAMTRHPVKIKRLEMESSKEYRGPFRAELPEEAVNLMKKSLIEIGINPELVRHCIYLARDKEERLYSEWIEKALKAITL
jgi:hypothetical protein